MQETQKQRTIYLPQAKVIIIMKICEAPTLRLKALNKHNITHIMYSEMENVISNLTKS